ncbi:hypothetical protein PQX77_021395 [Marasmius sp. AFHP31]|nr:hypothetical protein PQX77_021395 [Marasmius sp. AFHP31]
MGGLLVAEAATDPSMQCKRHPRIVGMIAFDCPYLGMHPRVIATGIASLFAKKPDQGGKSEQDMNPDPGVTVMDNTVTDGWEEFKKNMQKDNVSLLSVDSAHTASTSTLSPSPTHSRSGSNSSLNLSQSPSPSPSSSFVDRTVNFLSKSADSSMAKWLRKHRASPWADGKIWITEHYQFGSSMFDPSGLANRYKRLVAWNGLWVNYWTTTYPKGGSDSSSSSPSSSRSSSPTANQVHAALLEPDNDVAARMLENSLADRSSMGSSRRSHGSSSPSLISHDSYDSSIERDPARTNRLQKGKESTSATPKPPKEKTGRHFIVLPTGMGSVFGGFDKWEKVVVSGADDVVAAHCGIFMPDQNLEYGELIERVARRVFDWCEKI